ncbi:MAG: chitobiase/beta-hexosaminidase C-terminal domain-containing protein [Bacteroidaceae bacterium]|nr:chitobiase/beta-hexosaminidase C-terminal domain-containing protein [Bacteroidaceae bacterium]
MKQKLLKSMLLLCILVGGVSSAWGDSYTTTFSTGSGDGTNASTSTSCSTIVSAGASYLSGNLVTATNVYYSGSDGLKLGKSSGGGTIKMNLASSVTPTSIVVNAKLYNSSKSATLKVNGSATQSVSSDFSDLTYNITSSTSYLQLESSKYIWIKSITVNYTQTHTLTYSATNGSIGGVVYNTSTAVSSGASIVEGGKVTLTATPASGYAFTGWSVSENGGTFSDASANPTTFTMGTANATVTANFEASSTVANPTFTVSEGTYNEAKSVEINCSTDGATIYYTTDGTDPTTSSTEYTGAISVTQTTTIKAFAVKDGMTNSGIASATYTLKCATPEITVPEGAFLETKVVTITSSDGTSIYYTIDGSEPTSSSTAYAPSNKPSISATTTIKAIAAKSGWSDSEVATETFTKIVPLTVAEAIAATPSSGTSENKYIHGIVSGFYDTSIVGDGSNYRYYISDDGTTTNQLLVYKGKGLNNVAFSAASDLEVGDEVVIYGGLTTYNSTKEVASGNYLISRVTKTAPTFTLDPTSKTLDAYSHETVDVTLTTNTDGAITCESSNEDVATVALKSGNVYTITAKTEGTATITISSAASATYKPASATVEITVTDNRTDAGISFAKDAEEITWGESFIGQTLTNTNSVAVEWSSTNEAVATVDNTGAVTVLKAGTTEIKATFAGNATYKAVVASYTLTVNKANAGLSYTTTSFDIMLNDDTFEAPALNNPNGLTITYTSSNTGVATVNATTGELSYVASAVGTAKITATFVTNDWYKGGSANYTINIIDPTVKGTKYNPYTVAEVEGQATATTLGNNIYVTGYIVGFVNSNKCYKKTTDKLGNTNFLLADTPDFSFTEGANVASNTDGMIPVELPNSGTIRADWGPSSKNVFGYKVILKGNAQSYFSTNAIKGTSEVTAISVPATFNTSGYATFASTYPLDFTDDSEFSAWQITGVNGTAITFSQITGAVAAGTGVLLKGAASATISIPVAASGTDISATNKLTGITTATAIEAGTYYGLKDNKFVKVNAGTVPAGKALLPVSAVGAGVKEFTFIFEGENETAINSLTPALSKGEGVIFNLAGQRLQKMQKGINIVNGKKILF